MMLPLLSQPKTGHIITAVGTSLGGGGKGTRNVTAVGASLGGGGRKIGSLLPQTRQLSSIEV